MLGCPASFWRYLYTEVGRAYHWIDRLPWTDEEARAYRRTRAVAVADDRGRPPAGYFELRRDRVGGTEIVYFGLLPEFTAGASRMDLLTEAVERAGSSARAASGFTPTR